MKNFTSDELDALNSSLDKAHDEFDAVLKNKDVAATELLEKKANVTKYTILQKLEMLRVVADCALDANAHLDDQVEFNAFIRTVQELLDKVASLQKEYVDNNRTYKQLTGWDIGKAPVKEESKEPKKYSMYVFDDGTAIVNQSGQFFNVQQALGDVFSKNLFGDRNSPWQLRITREKLACCPSKWENFTIVPRANSWVLFIGDDRSTEFHFNTIFKAVEWLEGKNNPWTLNQQWTLVINSEKD